MAYEMEVPLHSLTDLTLIKHLISFCQFEEPYRQTALRVLHHNVWFNDDNGANARSKIIAIPFKQHVIEKVLLQHI